ncbi:Predicted methyltransferase [Ceraceosorus bombacis]|uniref:Predicted methyltransferase n=1 Tax=Ceraceosorus bombacis TaxID=401625 RepID=A0A0N7L9R7_9BASI|nr:Predicted methyltransferase [Ceraceosorus bombacis]
MSDGPLQDTLHRQLQAEEIDDETSHLDSDSDSDSDSDLEIFSSGLDALFDHHMPASGTPGSWTSFSHPILPLVRHGQPSSASTASHQGRESESKLRYLLPPNSTGDTQLMAHYQWDAGVLLSRILIESSVHSNLQTKASISPTSNASPSRALPRLRGANLTELFNMPEERRILEVGAGAGLPSLVAARLAASLCHSANVGCRARTDEIHVTVTDYPSAPVLSALQASVRKEGTQIKVRGLEWGNEEAESRLLSETSQRGFDVILAADTLWLTDQHPLLLHTFRRLLKPEKNAVILLAFGFHTGPFTALKFLELAAEAGLVVGRMKEEEQESSKAVDESTSSHDANAMAKWLVRQTRPGSEDEDDATLYDVREWKGGEEETDAIQHRGHWSAIVCLRWSGEVLSSNVNHI